MDPQPIDGLPFAGNSDPAVSDNPHELWFTHPSATNSLDILIATRSGDAGPFENVAAFSGSSAAYDGDPTLPADGLSVLFISDKLGVFRAFEATRASLADSFGTATDIAPMLSTAVAEGIACSYDGLRLYYADGNGDVRMTTRPGRADTFGPEGALLAMNAHFPSVSPDELELYAERRDAAGNPSIVRFVRTTTTQPFSAQPEVVLAGATSAYISPDSSRLYLSVNGVLDVMSRTCL